MITCTFPDGNKARLRHVSTASIVVKDNQVLLIRRAPNMSEGGKIGLPGGYLEYGETTSQGAIREVLEETGYQAKNPVLLQVVDNPARRHQPNQVVDFVYLLTPGNKVSEPDKESTEVFWLDLDKLPNEEEWAFDHYEYLQLYLTKVLPNR